MSVLVLRKIFGISKNFIIPNQLDPTLIKHLLYINEKRINSTIVQMNGIDIIKNSTNFNYIPLEIRKEIDGNLYKNTLFSFSLNSGRIIKLYIITEINDPIKYDELYEKICVWLSILDKISQKKCSKKLKIYMLLTDHLKLLPKKKCDEIDRINANSAFTFSCKETNEIFIFRKEEIFKVFIHETFHSFGLDFSSCNDRNANDIIKKCFKGLDIHCDYRIYESYAEVWAQIINILIISNNNIEKINEFIFYEKLWSILQCEKVLHHYKIRYIDLFKNKNVYSENKTHIFSYYILRAIVMVNINPFINFCSNGNKSNLNMSLVVFKKNQEKIDNYCKFICNNSKSIELINGLDIVEKWLENNNLPNYSKNDKFALTSLKMSLYG